MIGMILALRPYSKGAYKWLFVNLLAAVIGNGLILVNPLLIGFLVKDIVLGVTHNQVQLENIIFMLILVASFYVVGTILLWISQSAAHKYATLVTQNIRKDAFHIITHTPLSYLDRQSTGDILTKFSQDMDLIFDALSHFFMQFFQGATTIIVSIGLMIYLNIWLTLIVILTVPVILLYSSVTKKKGSRRFVEVQKLTGKLTALTHEFIAEKKLVMAYNYEKEAESRFDEVNKKLTTIAEKAYFVASINNPTYRMFNNIAYALLGLTALILHLVGHGVSIDVMTSMIMYAAMFSRPFNEFSVLTANFFAGRAGLKRVNDLLEQETEIELADVSEKSTVSTSNVSFKQVDFAYDKAVPLIKDFNLEVKTGQKIAIVGPTGSGKSTMINLLMRYYDIDKGSISLDGRNIRSYTRNDLRLNFGLVLQEPWLFNGSIADNLKYGRKDATDHEMIEAAKKANCHDFISKLKNGYDTILGEDLNLSVGQKQLLTIARALIINPPILILDEATSNIDSLMEKDIQETFAAVMKGKTSFVIAHRLKTIVDADIIIVMNKGRIVEYGSHTVLMHKQGFYAELYQSQFQG